MKKPETTTAQMLSQEMQEQAAQVIQRRNEERREMLESELYDIDFTLFLDRDLLKLPGLFFLMMAPVLLKIFARSLWDAHERGGVFSAASYPWKERAVVGVLAGVAFLLMGYYMRLRLKPQPRVKGSSLCYRRKTYHYSEITGIRVYLRACAVVSVHGKYAFWVSSDLEHFWSFLAWAEKCGIPMHGKTTPGKPSSRGASWDRELNPGAVIMILVLSGVLFPILVIAAARFCL